MIGFLTDFLGIRGINFNLRQFIFGLDTMKSASTSSHDTKKLTDMIHLAMESDEDLYNDDSKPLDKGKGVDRGESIPLDKDKGVDRGESMPLDKGKGKEVEPATAPLGFI
jgi:hypothetical protein